MTRRVRQRVDRDIEVSKGEDDVGWINLPYDTVVDVFTRLMSNGDRASLASTCSTWRSMAASPSLWRSLDLCAVDLDLWKAAYLSQRCSELKKIRFRGVQSANAIVFLRVRKLVEMRGDYCTNLTDRTLCMLAERHQALKSLELGHDSCEKITSEAIKGIASWCKKLRKLRLSGLKEVSSEAIRSLAEHCPQLSELGLFDCLKIDEVALGKVVSLRYLSVSGTSNIEWSLVADNWDKLPNLIGLDVSRTDIGLSVASRLLKSLPSLKVFCALRCPLLKENTAFISSNSFTGTVLFGFNKVTSVFSDKKPTNVLAYWRALTAKDQDIDETLRWSEWIISHTLVRIAETDSQASTSFWLNGGITLLLSLFKSSQEDILERAATGVATFIFVGDPNGSIDNARVEAIVRGGVISILLELANSGRESLQAEATKAITKLSSNATAAQTVAEAGGINALARLAKSWNRFVAKEACGGLWNLSTREDYKSAIADIGGAKTLVEILYRWLTCYDKVLERAAGTLANLATNEKHSILVAEAGGVHVLVMVAQNSKYEGAQEQAARALANLTSYGFSNNIHDVVAQEADALKILVKLTQSPNNGVKREAAEAICNLLSYEENRESIVALGGIKTLVELADYSCTIAFPGPQKCAAGALWGLSASEEISIAIGNEGGIPPLVALVGYEYTNVYENVAGALWNLAFHPINALRIVEAKGVNALGIILSRSLADNSMARFMAVLTLTYMLDGRMKWKSAIRTLRSSYLSDAKKVALDYIDEYIRSFVEPQFIAAAVASSFSPSVLKKISEKLLMVQVGQLKCSGPEIRRFVAMLQNTSPQVQACAAFALLQFTKPGGHHAKHHASLIQNAEDVGILRSVAEATRTSPEGKLLAKLVLRNLELNLAESS